LFHSLRHTYTSLLARSAPVKVTQELARHSTPVLTLGRYTHTTLSEKAEAVAALPLPGSATTAGPFAGMGRAELEATAEALLVALLLAPRLAPDRETAADGMRQEYTIGRQRGSSPDSPLPCEVTHLATD
ncbi:MAG TPA: hypothetical protein VKE74_02110, partial [Gemmataceae bacterium]|nr:hypothetical protein [Gemmataceae bacterium]